MTHIKADHKWTTRCGLDLGNEVWRCMPTVAEVGMGARATCKRCLATIKHVRG